jgi:hypothetical protein|tara:strand:- start:290 stop:493 length:204 start_codon:yes stop_codon:yes gene_type:complete
MAGKKKPKGLDYADRLSRRKATKAKFDDKFGDPIKKLDDLFLSLKPKKKKIGGAIMRKRGGTFKGTF